MNDFLKDIDSSWCLFLDRDGVINRRIYGGYVSSWKEFEFLPEVKNALRIFSGVFKYIFIITNQQGIGKGLMSETNLAQIHSNMISEIELAGGRITKIYHCPDLAQKPDNCRKPSPFMAQKAKVDFPVIDFQKSIMIGDSKSDILFGKNSNMYTVLQKTSEDVNITANMKINNLLEFAKMLNVNV
ncbi:MAG: phosphatase [Marinilabiliales bacterium]|nr:MAG: phosphatase [Marinilabiliales bacterium]